MNGLLVHSLIDYPGPTADDHGSATVEFRQIKCFVTLAEELHFGRAASMMLMAQPVLTHQIQVLEKELGVQLFIRSTRRVQLTPAGEVFYERAVQQIRDLENTFAVVRAVAGRDVAKITIGTIYPATFGVLPRFLASVARRFPDIQLHITNGTTDTIIREIERGRVNVGFIRPVENNGALRWQNIATERYLLAVAANSPLARAEKITMADLHAHKIIAFSRSNLSYAERYFFELYRTHRLIERIAYSCDDTLSLVSLVSAGLGIGFVPEWTRDLPNPAFCLREVEGVDFKTSLGLAWSKDDPTANRDELVDIARALSI